MDVAVVIPFRGDAGVLRWTLEGFAQQELARDVRVEVRVCGDGVELPELPEGGRGVRFSGITTERVGVAEAKNLLLRGRPADVVIFGNSDTRPQADFVAVHVARLMGLPAGHLVLGSAPYERSANPTVFDVLMEESPMIFFYPQMKGGDMYGFRNCWTLNLSGRYADLERVGFFDARFRPYGYEDLDLGFRLMGAEGKGIYFEPGARVVHRHPMTFDDYLNREELLGVMAAVLHDVNEKLFHALFGSDSLETFAKLCLQWVEVDLPMHEWIYRRMQEWNDLPASELGTGASRERLLMTLYQMHVPLKRFAFRQGFLRGLQLRDDGRWKERVATRAWKV
jgi:GT2 family glycosyltransferase